MHPQNSKIGLACAGGVIEGAIYEIGALNALEEAIDGIHFHDLDVYVGVSSGGLISACLANRVTTKTLARSIIGKAEPALNVDPGIFFKPAFSEYARRLLRLPREVLSTLGQALRHPGDLSLFGLLTNLGAAMPAGLFDNAPIQQFIARSFSTGGRTDDFRQLHAMLRIVAMDLDTAEIVRFGEPAWDDIPISKAIQASTALPGLYCPVEINDRYYIDGVARRTVHASVALNQGTNLLFCINPIVPVNIQLQQKLDQLRGEGLVHGGLPAVLSQTFRAIVDSRKRTGFKKYAHTHPNADLILIEPDYEETRMFFSNIFSFSNRHDVVEMAYQATRQHLLEQADAIRPKLERHGLQLNTDALRDPDRTLFGSIADELPTPHRTPVYEETDHALQRLDRLIERMQGEVEERRPG